MEIIGCIQTLGHLNKMLRWPAYDNVRDTAAVMLADNEPTYELVEKMVAQIGRCISSRRIHIGMDETFDLGLGEYLRRNGYVPEHEIYNRHLGRIVEICKKHGLKPMIWSDMYFRDGIRANENYEPTKVVSEEVKNSIPKEVELVFWDYYHENKKFYTDLIVKHRQLGKEPLMASGVWTWRRFWYDKTTTQNTAGPCIDACRETEVKELFFTMWGDDGAYCEYDSALAGLAWCAEKAFSKDGKLNEQKLRKSFDAICGVPYDDIEKAAGLNDICTLSEYMWEDPIFGVEWNERKKENANYWKAALEKCDAVLEDIKPLSDIEQPVDFSHANAIVETIKSRIELGLMVDKLHYADNDSISFALDSCDKVIGNIDNLLLTFRRQWLARNKIEGLELIQTRLAGQKERYCELKRMILHKSHMVSHRVQHHVLALNDCNV